MACEVILTAGVVSFYEIRNNEQRKFLLGGIERRLEKFQEPPPVKAIKPLAPPTDPGRKIHRKMKESLGMRQFCTETNQMTFGEVRILNNEYDLFNYFGFLLRLKKMLIKI